MPFRMSLCRSAEAAAADAHARGHPKPQDEESKGTLPHPAMNLAPLMREELSLKSIEL